MLACGSAVTLSAQNERFLGIWELNVAKSSFTRGAAPRSELIANFTEPGGFRSVLSGVTERGTSVEIHHYRFDGAFHQTEGSDPRELSFRRVDANTIEQETRRNGQVTRAPTDSDLFGRKHDDAHSFGHERRRPEVTENDTRVYEKR